MRAFEQQAFALGVFLVQGAGDIVNHRQDACLKAVDFRHDFVKANRGGMMQVFELDVVEFDVGAHFFRQLFIVEQIHHPHGAAGDFVFVSRADAAAGRADFFIALRCFARLVQGNVVGQDESGGRRDFQTAFHVFHACGNQFVDFAQQGFGGNHHAGADEAVQFFMQDAARNQAQDGFFAADNQRVAGIVPALEADHAAGLLGQPIHNLAFAFVAPLRTDDHYVLRHTILPR